ncbi:hypothetical protein [Actinomadura rudentiformis]|uniref:Tissue inhibitor of metalloproteinase n=1 Tax=Actinomadura rudentiformis TaxID=359158 RepID=A0A6H9Z993_9ACTN|nr:hypothetical protein [Actinomadura rudentiformis]KAB2352235.1 hypothetical protein F8566_00540 [Actinomadura rudentiformis]
MTESHVSGSPRSGRGQMLTAEVKRRDPVGIPGPWKRPAETRRTGGRPVPPFGQDRASPCGPILDQPLAGGATADRGSERFQAVSRARNATTRSPDNCPEPPCSGVRPKAVPSLTITRTLIALAVVLLVGAATPGRACACSCATMTDQEAYAKADAVFTGRVLQRQVESQGWGLWKARGSGDPTTLVFEVSAVNKGKVSRRQDLHTVSESATCGLEAQKGREYLVFAQRDGDVLRANLCGGTRPAGKPLSVPSAPAHSPAPMHAPAGSAPSPQDVNDDLPVAARVAIAGGLVAPLVVVLFLLRRRRQSRT